MVSLRPSGFRCQWRRETGASGVFSHGGRHQQSMQEMWQCNSSRSEQVATQVCKEPVTSFCVWFQAVQPFQWAGLTWIRTLWLDPCVQVATFVASAQLDPSRNCTNDCCRIVTNCIWVSRRTWGILSKRYGHWSSLGTRNIHLSFSALGLQRHTLTDRQTNLEPSICPPGLTTPLSQHNCEQSPSVRKK